MALPSEQLQGAELIDCARANASYGIEVAADRCGYGQNLSQFEAALQQAYTAIGVSLSSFDDLLKTTDVETMQGEVVAPDTIDQL